MKHTAQFCVGLLLSVQAAFGQEPTATGHVVSTSLSAGQVLDNYEKAIGGKQAWQGITSRMIKGELQLPETNVSGTFESYEVQPGQIYSVMNLDNGTQAKVGFDGEIGWSNNTQTGLRKLRGEELLDIKRGAQLPEEVNFRRCFTQFELKGKAKVAGRDAYVILATSPDGSPWTIYFDAKTWLRVRLDWTHGNAEGPEAVHVFYDDYRELKNFKIKCAFRITQKASAYTVVQRVASIELNKPIDKAFFKAPSFKVTVR